MKNEKVVENLDDVEDQREKMFTSLEFQTSSNLAEFLSSMEMMMMMMIMMMMMMTMIMMVMMIMMIIAIIQ